MDTRRIPFTEEDERRIASASTWGIIIAVTSIATAVISLLMQSSGLYDLLVMVERKGIVALFPLGQAAVTVLVNVWLLQASLAFRKVAHTDEADQAHLLAGFRHLRGYFMVQVIVILAAIGLSIFFMLFAASILGR